MYSLYFISLCKSFPIKKDDCQYYAWSKDYKQFKYIFIYPQNDSPLNVVSGKHVKISLANTGIFRDNKVNTMVVDGLNRCVVNVNVCRIVTFSFYVWFVARQTRIKWSRLCIQSVHLPMIIRLSSELSGFYSYNALKYLKLLLPTHSLIKDSYCIHQEWHLIIETKPYMTKSDSIQWQSFMSN